MIIVDKNLRLNPRIPTFETALAWYQDPELVYLVDGIREPYSLEKLQSMYTYLAQAGELYTIEVHENGKWKQVGDVTFSAEDLPIVIREKPYQGQGIGRKVLTILIEEAKKHGYKQLTVREFYDHNLPSPRCFAACGFKAKTKTQKGWSWELGLE